MHRRSFLLLPVLGLAACDAPTGAPAAIQDPPPGKAQVYIIRPRTVVGSGNVLMTQINGETVSQLQVGQYTIVPVEPGQTVLTMKNRVQGPLPLLDVRLLQELGGFQEVGRVTLAEGQTAFMEYHWVKWTDQNEASRLLGAGPKYVPPIGPAGASA